MSPSSSARSPGPLVCLLMCGGGAACGSTQTTSSASTTGSAQPSTPAEDTSSTPVAAATWSIKATIDALSGDADAHNAETLPPTLLVVEVADAADTLAHGFTPASEQAYVRALHATECAVSNGKPALPCTYTFDKLDLSAYKGGALLRASDNRPSRSGPDWQSSFAFVSPEALAAAKGNPSAPAPAAVTVWSGSGASAIAAALGVELQTLYERGGMVVHFTTAVATTSESALQLSQGVDPSLTVTYPSADLSGKGQMTSSNGLAVVTPSSAKAVSTSGWVGTKSAASYPVPEMSSSPQVMLFTQAAPQQK